MSGLSSGTDSWGGDAGRLRGGGEGERCLKKVRIVPFAFFFFFWGEGLVGLTGATWTGISSSVEGGEDSSESESAMLGVVRAGLLEWWSMLRLADEGGNNERSTARHA